MNNEIKFVSPFKYLCMTVGNLPSSYIESMSYYEALTYMEKLLEKEVIPTINNNSTALEELQNYVVHYFDNLDVQEEINNKLDDMAEAGTLQEVIGEYLDSVGLVIFNTKADMVASENLINGSRCKTLGTISYNDGYGEIYMIRTITSGDVVDDYNIVALNVSNTLIAERIPDHTSSELTSFIGKFATAQTIISVAQADKDEDISGTISYPTGFTKDNCFIISYLVKRGDSTWKYSYTPALTTSSNMIPQLYFQLGNSNISVAGTCKMAFGESSNVIVQMYGDYTIKVLLYKYA